MNGSVETEAITKFPLNPYLLQGQQALPNCKPISVGHPSDARYMTPSTHNHQNIGSRDTVLQTGYTDAKANAKVEADTDSNGIHTKHNMSHSPCWADIINQL